MKDLNSGGTTVGSTTKLKNPRLFVPPNVDDHIIAPPQHIADNSVARDYYYGITKYLKDYKMYNGDADALIIGQAAVWQALFDEISAELMEGGLMLTDDRSKRIKDLAMASTKSISLFMKLGLSPLSRETMKSFVGKEREPEHDTIASAFNDLELPSEQDIPADMDQNSLF